jgi:putative copper resistance protein D
VAEALVALWFVQFAAAMSAFGCAAFRLYTIGTPASLARWIAGAIRIAAAVAVVAAAATAPATAAEMSGSPALAFDPATLVAVLTATTFGHVWRWHLGFGLALTAAAFCRPGRAVSALLLALAALNLGSLAWIGHAAMMPGLAGVGHELNQALHLLAAGAWIGGLMPLLVLLRRARSMAGGPMPDFVREAVSHFSQMGYAAVGLIAVTGAINAILLVGSVGALFGTAYGRLLCVKILLFLAMVAVAAANRLHLAPRLMRDPAALIPLTRNVLLEQALGIAILAAASLLGTWPPAAMGHAM